MDIQSGNWESGEIDTTKAAELGQSSRCSEPVNAVGTCETQGHGESGGTAGSSKKKKGRSGPVEQASKRLIKGKFYVIYWRDHAKHESSGAWVSKDDVNMDLPIAVSSGWIIQIDKKTVAIAQTVDGRVGIDGEVGNIWYIMRSCIEKVVQFELPKVD